MISRDRRLRHFAANDVFVRPFFRQVYEFQAIVNEMGCVDDFGDHRCYFALGAHRLQNPGRSTWCRCHRVILAM